MSLARLDPLPNPRPFTREESADVTLFCDELIDLVHSMRLIARWHDRDLVIEMYQTFYETVENLGTLLGLEPNEHD